MTQDSATPGRFGRFTQFNRDFWTINGIELLERGAYYSLSAVFTVFMLTIFRADGMTEANAGALAGSLGAVLFLLLYAVPLVAAALAEKYGYKAALAVCFALLLGGYVAAIFATGLALIVTAVILVGFGAGIFKPIAAAMVSQTTTESQRNFAFTIYYGCINIGAVLFPLAVGLAGLLYPDRLALIAFGTAAALTSANLILTLTVFRNIREPQKDKSVFKALAALGDVFKTPSFFVLLVIYAGFWFMYAMSLTFLSAYMVDFARMPSWFNIALLLTINPAVIILAAPFIGGLTSRFNSLALMIGGISLYAIGLIVLGFSSTQTLFIGGIVLFSIGELLTHPSYLSYVSKLAPPEKVSVYMGYGFIPIAVGLFFGTSVGGALYGSVAREQGLPARFWALMAAVGLVTIAALIIYNQFMTRRARIAAGEPVATTRRRGVGFFAGPAAALVALLLIPALISGATLAPSNGTTNPLETLGATGDLQLIKLDAIEDTTREGSSTNVPMTLPASASGEGELILKWQDEAAGAGQTNMPDSFRLHVTLPNGTMLVSDEVSTGTISLKFPAVPGDHIVMVEMVNAGDQTVNVGPLTLPQSTGADTGNAWTLERAFQSTT